MLAETLWKCGGVPITPHSQNWSALAANRAASGGSTAQIGPLFQTVQCLSRGMNKTQTQKSCEEARVYVCGPTPGSSSAWAVTHHTYTHTTNSTTSASEPRLTHPHTHTTHNLTHLPSCSLLPYCSPSLTLSFPPSFIKWPLHNSSCWHRIYGWGVRSSNGPRGTCLFYFSSHFHLFRHLSPSAVFPSRTNT